MSNLFKRGSLAVQTHKTSHLLGGDCQIPAKAFGFDNLCAVRLPTRRAKGARIIFLDIPYICDERRSDWDLPIPIERLWVNGVDEPTSPTAIRAIPPNPPSPRNFSATSVFYNQARKFPRQTTPRKRMTDATDIGRRIDDEVP
jgi:hypothetical protein